MANKELHELLKIGLTEGEAKVYLALSELGSSTVGPIVKKTKVANSPEKSKFDFVSIKNLFFLFAFNSVLSLTGEFVLGVKATR